MATRSDVVQDYTFSPRISTVQAPSTSFPAQDVVDTLRVIEEQFEGMTQLKLLNATGKDALDATQQTPITAALQNDVIEFEARFTPAETGDATTATTVGPRNYIRLIDINADFTAANVQPGSFVVNWDDRSITDVRRVISSTELECKALVLGTDNDWDLGDAYAIWNIIQCEVGEGNVIAVDTDGTTPISAFLPSAFTQIVTARASSAAVVNLGTIETQVANIHGQVERSVYVDTTALINGTDGYQQAPFNNVSDAIDYMENNNLRSLVLLSDVTLDRDLVGFNIRGIGTPTIDSGGFALARSELRGLRINGTIAENGLGGFRAFQCNLADNVEGLEGFFYECGLEGTINIAEASTHTPTTVFQSCFSTLGGAGQRPTVNVNGGVSGADVSFRGWRGGLNVQNVINALDAVTIGGDDGMKVTLEASCSAGDISIRGNTQYTDNSTGATVDIEATIAAQVWNATLAMFNAIGSAGAQLAKALTVGKWLALRGGTGK